jgi:hypothetical protein
MAVGLPGNQPSAEPPLGPNPRHVDPARLSLPLDRFEMSLEDRFTVNRARIALMVECLRRHGIQIDVPAPRPVPWARHAQRYGLADADRAAQHGYHVPEIADQPAPREPSLPAEIADDCLARATRHLDHGVAEPAEPHLAQALGMRAFRLSRQDIRVQAVFGSWRRCMQRAGWDYPDPMAANNDPFFATDEPTEREIATAIADVRCKRAVGVVAVWSTMEAAYQQRAVDENRDQLEVARRAVHVRIANARAVLNGS